MNIKRRIWSLPTTAIVIFCIGLAVCVYFSTLSINAINRNSSVDFPALDKIKTFSIDVERLAKDLADSAGDADKKRFASVQIKANQMLSELKSLGELEGQRAIATRLHKEFDDYYQPSSMVVKIMLGMNDSDAAPLIAKMRSAIKVLQDDLSQAQARSQAQFDGGVEICKRNVQRVLDTIIAIAVAVIAILLGSSFFVVRGIWLQLGGEPEYTRDIAVSIAAGDLSMHINTANSDSGSLLTALNEMKTRLEQMITGVIISAQTIKIASSEIASGNIDLSTRTEEQANSLQRTASSMHGIENTVNQNAENASIATQYADAASQVAIKGGQVVCQVIETMSEINSSSKKIVDIISVIDGIAFQTNILALNAAVEAARAGEQGRGFAVVAAEVRNLAQRSAGAAKEITALISDSVNKVNHGSVLVDRAGKTMDEIVESVRRVSDIMKEISSASQNQSTSIHEIDSVISHMDEMTQQNSAMVEQAAAAAASMQAEAGNLMTALEVFKLSVPESIKHRSAMPLLAN